MRDKYPVIIITLFISWQYLGSIKEKDGFKQKQNAQVQFTVSGFQVALKFLKNPNFFKSP